MRPLNKIGRGCCSIIAVLGDLDLDFGVVIPRAATSSNLGLASLSAGVCWSQQAVFLTVMEVPPGPASLTVSIFMCSPASNPQVTWKAMKQLFLWHCMHAPTPLCLHTLQVSFHLAGGICPMLSIGSRKTVLANLTSGIHRPHTTCAHLPSSVCLKAPPRLGQRQHSTLLLGDWRHLLHSHCPSGM